MVGFSVVDQQWQMMVVWWMFLGPAQAMIYYEPVYVAIDEWAAPADRARALATITLIAGLAGIVFIPLIAQLVSDFGWRPAVRGLGVLLLVTGIFTAARSLPSRIGTRTGPEGVPDSKVLNTAFVRDSRFLLFTLAQTLILLATRGVIAHRVARFQKIGYSLATVALWAAAASTMSLPGRWVAPRLAQRFSATWVQAVTALIMAVSVLLMVKDAPSWQMVGHIFLFGLAIGALLPLRAMVMGDSFSGPMYGRIVGKQLSSPPPPDRFLLAHCGILRADTGCRSYPTLTSWWFRMRSNDRCDHLVSRRPGKRSKILASGLTTGSA